MAISNPPIPGLVRVPVSIEGGWVSDLASAVHEWRGTVTAAEPIQMLLLLDDGTSVHWVRPCRRVETSSPLKLVWTTPQPTERPLSHLDLRSSVPRASDIGVTGTFPTVPRGEIGFELGAFETGVVRWFARIGESAPLRLGLLVLVKAQTRHARVGLWTLRRGVAIADESLAEMLRHGRHGVAARSLFG